MKILYLAHRIPYPPNKGEKIRAFHQLQHLAQRHTVHLACLVDERDDLVHLQTLQQYCASVDAVYRGKKLAQALALLALPSAQPLSVASFYSHQLAQKIRQRLQMEPFDCIFIYSSTMAEYVRQVADIPKVMDFVDVDSEKWRLYADFTTAPMTWLYRLEATRLARYEAEIARTCAQSILISDLEAACMQHRVPERTFTVIPNGVDLAYFAPSETPVSCYPPGHVVFAGAMDYFPNVDAVQYFCSEIFPLLRQALPEARCTIVGRNPTPQVRRLGEESQITVTGAVPDVRPYLAQAQVAVAPLRIARGVQNKVLEAMAMGLPVVGTSTAFAGLQATAADGIRVADDPQAFAQAVLTLCTDSQLHYGCAQQARRYVQTHHQWADHGSLLEALLHKVCQETPGWHVATATQVAGKAQ
jgi:sugar transferase (PEP-CTERM/EpsH1 system associated)